jgi:hypothetical protein
MYKKTLVINSFGDITEEIEREQAEEYEQISNDASMIKEIFQDLSNLTGQCYEPLNDVLNHTEHTVDNTEQGTRQLIQASTINTKNNKLLLTSGSIIGGSIGLIIGGVIGSVLHIPGITIGSQIGLITGCLVGGGSLGTGIGVLSAFSFKK